MEFIDGLTRQYGASARTFKSALIFCVPESAAALREDARKLLAWEAIEEEGLNLDDQQRQQLGETLKKARRDLRETVWRTYKVIALLGKDNVIKRVDLGLVHSSAANDIVGLVLSRLRQDGDLESGISPNFLVRNWPPAFKEWSTKAVRDAFYASPQFPRLPTADAVKDTIVRGVGSGLLAYVGKTDSGSYRPFNYNQALMTGDVELSDDMFLITKETAEAYLKKKGEQKGKEEPVVAPGAETAAGGPNPVPANGDTTVSKTPEKPTASSEQLTFTEMNWAGEIPHQKWMNFYTKVLSKFANSPGLKLKLKVEISPEGGVSKQKIEETKSALRDLGFSDEIDLH